MSPVGEKLLTLLGVFLAAAILTIGIALAWYCRDAHWVNRSGAGIVCAQALVLIAEFSLRMRVKNLEADHHLRREYLHEASTSAEARVLILSIALATVGEFLHGFGDLLVEIFV